VVGQNRYDLSREKDDEKKKNKELRRKECMEGRGRE